jgi:hypothetical protein
VDGLSGHPPPIAGRAPACNCFFLQANPSRGPTGRKNRHEPAESRQVARAAHREITRPDDRVSAQRWLEAAPFREGLVERAVVRVRQSVLTTGWSTIADHPPWTTADHPRPRSGVRRASSRTSTPTCRSALGTAIAQGRRMIAQREERRHPGQAARERIRIPIDHMRGLAARACRGCTPP